MTIKVQNKGRDIQEFVFNPYQDFDSLDQEMQFYVEQSLQAIQVCDEASHDVNEKLINCQSEEEMKMISFPIIIDERS